MRLKHRNRVRTEYETGYIRELDITVIFKNRYHLSFDDEWLPMSIEVVGFYYGEPNETLTNQYKNDRKATF